ncbi:unnamed protein product [Candidula unifasciata]|uniref:Translation initiation factor eIF2B subunit gamma n=1 Tax=Candidula unifasciata TaxID=100452 RepID=A0A8S4A536_9EUPU|nr:unnamed protein product [Candidula unifasciata]
MSNPGDWTAVIMAGGSGSRMTDLTNQCPKALLPVGRFPMIWYPIRSLEKAGFSDIIIITRQSWQDQIHSALSVDTGSIGARLEMVGIPDSEDWGTADSLRHIADRIRTTALFVSCDLISDCKLSDLMLIHRKYNSSLTVILSQLPSSILAETPVPGFKSKQKNSAAEKISIGFESSNMDHVLYWKAQIDMEDEFVFFTRKFLDRFPCTRLQSTWADCHAYLINKSVIRYLKERPNISSLQGELLPLVVQKQMSMYVRDRPKEDADMASPGSDVRVGKKKDLVDFVAESESDLTNSVKFLSLTSDSFGLSEDSPQKDLVRCYAYRQTSGFCVRANTVAAYFEACKQMPRLIGTFWNNKKKEALLNVPESTTIKPKSQVGADCMLGESVTIGEKVSVKKSVIGKHCKIADKVRITNSVIMDHVTIQDSCNIINCIIADSANIGDKCELNNCIIGHNQSIPTMSKHTNEVVSNVSQMMEVFLE